MPNPKTKDQRPENREQTTIRSLFSVFSAQCSRFIVPVLKSLLLLIALTGVFLYTRVAAPTQVSAATPSTLNFQARLLTGTGAIVADGTYNVEFKLYNSSASSGSSQGSCTGDAACLWTETRLTTDAANLKVNVRSGYISVYLGDKTAFGAINWDQQLYLTMNIGGTSGPTWDGEMTPRLRLTSVPYAQQAAKANQISTSSGANTGTLSFSTLLNNPVLTLPDVASGTVALLQGAQTFTGATTFSSTLSANGNTTIGDATTDRLTVTSQILGGTPLVFQGATDDTFSTSFLFTDPTANNSITFPNASGTVQLAPTTGNYLFQVPASTAANTVTPTAASTVGLTVNATSGTSSVAAIFNQANNTTPADTVQVNTTNTLGTQTNGLSVARNGAGGTTTNLLNLANTAGTATNALNITGTFTKLINTPTFTVSNTGAIVGVGVNSGSGLLQGAAGLTVSGAAVSLNDSSNFNTSINTGNSNGTVTIGNTLAGAISLQGATTIGIANGTTGTAVNIGNTTSNPNIGFTGSGTFGTTTGTVSLNGNTQIAANKNFTINSGTGVFSQTYTGTANALSVTSSSTTDLNKTVNIAQTGATVGTDYAGYFSNTGAGTTNVGLYATASGATNNFAAIFESGNVGIGTVSPASPLHVTGTAPNSFDGAVARITGTLNSASANQQQDGLFVNPQISPGSDNGQTFIALNGNAQTSGTLTNGNLYGVHGTVEVDNTGNVQTAIGGIFEIQAYNTATIANASGFVVANPTKAAGATITSNFGVRVNAQTNGTSNTGIAVGQASGTNHANLVLGQTTVPSGGYSIYNSSTDQNYFGGNLGIGVASPNTVLDLQGAFSMRSTAAPGLSPATQGRIYFDGTQFQVSQNGGAYGTLLTAANAFVQNGNAFGATAVLGTTDANAFTIRTGAGTNTAQERLRVDASGNVGIGTASPQTKLDVRDTSKYAVGLGANTPASTNMTLLTTTAQGIGIGGAIGLGGAYDNAGTTFSNFATIQGAKENAVTGDQSGYLSLSTTGNAFGGGSGERLRITSGGLVGINTTAPLSTLSVNGGVAIGSYAAGNAAGANNLIVSGNVGIGTSSPGGALQVQGQGGVSSGAVTMTGVVGNNFFTTSSTMTLYAGDWIIPTTTTTQARAVTVGGTGTTFTISGIYNSGGVSAQTFTIYHPVQHLTTNTGASAMITQGSTGYVGIGTTTPTANLQVAGTSGTYITADVSTTQAILNLVSNGGAPTINMFTGANNGLASIAYGQGGFTGESLRIFNNEAGGSMVATFANNGFVGINTATPYALLDVNGGARFSGDLLQAGAGANGLGDSGSMVSNSGFEINNDATATVADGWTFTQSVGVSATAAVTSTSPAQGSSSQQIFSNSPSGGTLTSTCFPITGGRAYNLYARVKGDTGATGLYVRLHTFTTKSNCTANTSSTEYDSASNATVSTTFADFGGTITPATTQTWASVQLYNYQPNVSVTMTYDSVRLTPAQLTSGTDLAENYRTTEPLQPGDIVEIAATQPTSNGSADNSPFVTKSSGAYSTKAIGVYSTKPGITLGDGISDPAPVALAGRVPVKIASTSPAIKAGDYITTSEVAGEAMKATHPGQIIGKALEDWTPGTNITQIVVFVNISYADPTDHSIQASSATFTDLNVAGQATINNLTVTAVITTKDLTVTGSATIQDLTVVHAASINDLTVTGTATIEKLTVKDITVTGGLTVQGGITTALAKKTADYMATLSDSIITADAKDGVFHVTLPTAVGVAGRQFTVKKTDTTANAVTVVTTSVMGPDGHSLVPQTIDGTTTYTLDSPYKYLTVVSDGTNWIIVGSN